MAVRFKTKITKARFVYSPFTGQQMQEFGEVLKESIWSRISSGLNVYGAPARQLATGYAKYKKRRVGTSLRNLQLSGRLRRSTKVLTANQNRAVIGATPGTHSVGKIGRSSITFNGVLAVNNKRERQWGVSDDERENIGQIIAGNRPIRAAQVA